MTGRLGFDALGAQIEGQKGNRTPTTSFVYPRRPPRNSQDVRSADFTWGEANLAWSSWAGVAAANPLWSDLLHAGFPYLPGMARRVPTRPAPPSLIPYRINRYYQSFDVSGATLPNELVQRYRDAPRIQPASTVPNRIGRYYQLFDASTVTPTGDATVDRARQQASISSASAVPYRIGRYYQAFDVSTVAPVGDATVDRVRPQPAVTPTSSIPYRINRYYQSFDVSVVTPDQPVDRTRSQANPTTPTSVPYRIGRYYTSFVDVANTVTDPTDHAIGRPYAVPAPSVANRIQRYYSPQIIDVVGAQPADRAQPRVQVRVDPFRYANMVRRYYRYAPDGDVPVIVAVPPGSMTVTFSAATTTARFQSTANTTTTLSTA